MENEGRGKYLIAVTAAMIIWSTSYVVTKIAYESFPPLTLGALRFVVATVLLGAMIVAKGQFILPGRRDLVTLAVSGILGVTLYFALQNIGVSLTSASSAALIMSSYPAITLLMERIVYGMRVSWRKWLGIILAMLGIGLISGLDLSGGGEYRFRGNLILAATGIVWALYNFSTRKIVNRYPAVTVSFYQMLAGTLAFIPLTFTEMAEWKAPTALPVLMLLYLGVLCSVVGFLCYNYGLRKLSAGTAVSLANLVPVFGVLSSVVVLGESVNPWQLLGGVVVVGGVLLSVK